MDRGRESAAPAQRLIRRLPLRAHSVSSSWKSIPLCRVSICWRDGIAVLPFVSGT